MLIKSNYELGSRGTNLSLPLFLGANEFAPPKTGIVPDKISWNPLRMSNGLNLGKKSWIGRKLDAFAVECYTCIAPSKRRLYGYLNSAA